MDPDSSGVQDLSDLLSFLPYFGNSCDNLDWYDTTTGHIIDLAVVEYAVHTEDLMGIGGTLPAGSVTYHVYALLENPDDYLLAVFGDEDRPLVLETADVFYGFGNDLGETQVVSSIDPLFNSFFPANEFTSWFNAGIAADASSTTTVSYVAGFANWVDSLDPGSIIMDDSIGGAFFSSFPTPTSNNGAVPIGQFTVTDPSSFNGTINLLAKTVLDDGTEGFEFAEGLTFLKRRPHRFRVLWMKGRPTSTRRPPGNWQEIARTQAISMGTENSPSRICSVCSLTLGAPHCPQGHQRRRGGQCSGHLVVPDLALILQNFHTN